MSMPSAGYTLPEVNDLVSVTLKSLDSDQGEAIASDLPSRIEDVELDETTGRVLGYTVAAPRFSGNLDEPVAGAEFFLQWLSPRGVWLLPIRFQQQVTLDSGLQVWRVDVAGPPRREERRRFVRIPLNLQTGLEVRRNLGALPAQRRQRAEKAGVRTALPDLPDLIEARTLDLSEGGLRCRSESPILPAHLPLTARFTLGSQVFAIDCYVVWSTLSDNGKDVETAISFDESDLQCEMLRPLLFQAQLAGARQGNLG